MSTQSRSPLPHSSSTSSPLKRKAMSITQTYYLAHTARGKLASEASRQDHRLVRLVGHANMLDSLMLELSEAEQEQENWFNQSVKKATKTTTEQPKHIQWADTIVEDPEEDWQASDAESDDSESEYDSDDDVEMEAGVVSLQRVQSHQSLPTTSEEEVEFEDDGEEDFEGLQLSLSPSHPAHPPELDSDSDSSEDESMPPSPPSDSLPSFSEKQQIATTSYYSKKSESASIPPSEQQAFFDEGYYLPQRTGPGLISAISVY